MTTEPTTFELHTITEVFEFLDDLRFSGVTNMWGATPYILDEFDDLTVREAKTLHMAWIRSYGDGTESAEMRAEKVHSETAR